MTKRVAVDVDEALYDRLKVSIPWGLRRPLFVNVLTMIVDAVEKDGYLVAGGIMDGKYKLVLVDHALSPLDN